jgi:hypothetical protein
VHVLGAVHDAHAAAARHALDPVPGDLQRLPCFWIELESGR